MEEPADIFQVGKRFVVQDAGCEMVGLEQACNEFIQLTSGVEMRRWDFMGWADHDTYTLVFLYIFSFTYICSVGVMGGGIRRLEDKFL